MAHWLFILVALNLLIATNWCTAMKEVVNHQEKIFQLQKNCKKENINFIQSNVLQELSIEGENTQAEFLTNDDIVITDLNGYHITDLKTQKRITLNNAAFTTLVVHPNKQKFAIYLGNTIKIYDSPTIKKLKTFRSNVPIHIAIFHPSKEAIILCGKKNLLTQYNYTTNESYPITISTRYDNFRIHQKILNIAMHPTKNQLFLGHYSGYISVHNLDTNSEVQIIAPIPYRTSYACSRLISCSYNGEFIANCYGQYLDIVGSHSCRISLTYLSDKKNNTNWFKTLVFHPNNSVIAGLIAPDNCVACMDTKKEHYICILSPLFGEENTRSCHVLSFSPDGTKLIIVVRNKLFIMDVPFEVIYQDDTKAKLPLLFFFLDNIKNNFPITIPNDIITILKQNQINVFKR